MGPECLYEHVCKTPPQSLNADSSGMWPEQAEKFGRPGEPASSLPLQWDRIDLFREFSRTGLHNRQKLCRQRMHEDVRLKSRLPLLAGAGTPKHQIEKNYHAYRNCTNKVPGFMHTTSETDYLSRLILYRTNKIEDSV